MFTEKQTTYTIARIAALGSFAIGYCHGEVWKGLSIFGSLCCGVWLAPWLCSKLFLKKHQQEEVDGEISLLSTENNCVEYHLIIDKPAAIPYKDKLIFKVNDNVKLLTEDYKEEE